MRKYYRKEIEQFLDRLITTLSDNDMHARGYDILEVSDKQVIIRMYKEYYPFITNYDLYKKFADFFETSKVSSEDFIINGCKTCGFGSEYGFTVVIGSPNKNTVYIQGIECHPDF